MNHLYQRTFDHVSMPEDRVRSLRAVLASHCSNPETEVIFMNKQKALRRPAAFLVAVLLIVALSVTALACGGHAIYQLMNGGTMEQGIDENGNSYACGTLDLETVISPVELREDGRLYLTINEENLDITDQCSYTTPYIYECTGADGLRHAFVIGGDLNAIGWSEFLWDENGLPTAGTSVFGTNGGIEDAPWLDAAMDTLGLPW